MEREQFWEIEKEKMSSLDNLVDMEVWQLRIKDHRNSELREREREYVTLEAVKILVQSLVFQIKEWNPRIK